MIKLIDILVENCWKGYNQIGMKKKKNKLVPNCVPNKEKAISESIDFENFKTIVFKFTHAEDDARFQTIQKMLQTFKAIKDTSERKEAVKMLKQSGLIGYLKDAMNYSKLSETSAIPFGDKFGKNKWINLNQRSINDYADEIADLITQAYASKGGNFEIKNGDDIRKSDINFWIADDIDSDPDIDATLGGKKTPFGIKVTMMGQDGSTQSKQEVVKKMLKAMKTHGFYAEIDLPLAQKLHITNIIKDESIIRKVLTGKEITDFDSNTGEYSRTISGTHKHTKVLVGIPKV